MATGSTCGTGTEADSESAPTVTDAELLQRFREGDEAAFAQILRRYEGSLLAYLQSLVQNRSTSQDLSQDTFLKLINRPPGYLQNGSLRPWLFRIARNLAFDFMKKHGRVRLDAQIPEPGDLVPKSSAELGHADAEILLARLDLKQREVVALRIYGGLTFQEISKQTHVPLSTVIWRMRQAMTSMKTFLAGDGRDSCAR